MVDEIKDIKMEQKSTDYISETEASLARNNQMTMLGYTVYNVVLLLCYLLEVIKKSRTVGYYLVFSALSLLPLLFMFVIYNKNKSSKYIRTTMAVGYCVFYSFTVFTTVSPVAFVYGVLISLLIIQYANVFSSTICGIGMLVINIINVIVMGINGDIKSADLPNVEIRIGFTALYALFMVWVTKTLIKNNQAKISQVDQEKDNIASVLSQTMRISDGMINNISIVSEKIATLEESVDKTKISMEEVSSGTTDTSESVQKQLLMTEDIQNYIKLVGDVSDSINEDMEHANSEVSAGKRSIDDLINQVKASENASSKAADELTKLTSYATQMQGIVEIIENITSQTSLLSLNASIEAARVGEAGKGFAVVASEISNLADQTQTATVDIAELITNISAELDEVVKVINILIENNKLQATAANATAVNFEAVAERTGDITAKTEELSSLITELESSNGEIVDSIQTISSATEEVNAHATETLESSEENSMIVEDVRNMVVELQKYAESLTALEN